MSRVMQEAECAMSDKICIWCKQDCSTKPRQKDNQGRYLCRECVKPYLDAMKSEPAPRRSGTGDTAAIPITPDSGVATSERPSGDLLDRQVAKVSDTCPSCNRPMSHGAVICVHCGYNTETGRQLRSRVMLQKAPKKEKPKKKGMKAKKG